MGARKGVAELIFLTNLVITSAFLICKESDNTIK